MFLSLVSGLLLMGSVSFNHALEPWRIVNDGVMGGVSSSSIEQLEDHMVFSGELSLDNNGGFASARRLVDQDLEGTNAVQFEARGDGRRYQFRLRTDRNVDGVAWVTEFDSGPQWQTMTLPLSLFQAQFRGRKLDGRGDLDAARIRQLGFLLADKREGSFRLEFRDIRFISQAADPAP